MVLLLVTCKTDGASVAVDTKEAYVETVTDTKDAKETSNTGAADEQVDPRIGLYMQQYNPYGSVGPIGGNSAFYLTSIPNGNFECICR